MIRRVPLSHILASIAVVSAVVTCGCRARGRLFQRAGMDRTPNLSSEVEPEGQVRTASFERVCPPANQRPPGGYLQQGPAFSALDGVSSPQAAVAQLRHLASENERLAVEAARIRNTIGELQNELIQARQALLLSQEDCRAATSELIATRNQLEDWQRVMERTLDELQVAEQEHLRELDRAIEALRTVVAQPRGD
jgi:hypothetical protein